ncbi:MAG: RDD family protein [Kiloniellaceae bacterium]|nr:RDD family protein [Kiloniellaceae bacterium]
MSKMATTDAGANSEAQPRARSERRLLTPEGVPLIFQLAERGERAAAVLIDLLIMFTAIAALVLAFYFGLGWLRIDGVAAGLMILISFLIRSFYFIYFELRWQGQTPGKRALGIRVIDRRGGYLRPDSVFARNLLREVELFLPMTVLFLPSEGSQGWVNLLTCVWVGIFLLLPFFNKDRLRAGDIVAGTWVISAPKALLLGDVAAEAARRKGHADEIDPAFPFSRSQLEIYGIYELQTLEEVLRQSGPQTAETRREVASRIQRKIGWAGEDNVDAERFLQAFYAALRAHLEARLLFGERRKNKHSRKRPGGEKA